MNNNANRQFTPVFSDDTEFIVTLSSIQPAVPPLPSKDILTYFREAYKRQDDGCDDLVVYVHEPQFPWDSLYSFEEFVEFVGPAPLGPLPPGIAEADILNGNSGPGEGLNYEAIARMRGMSFPLEETLSDTLDKTRQALLREHDESNGYKDTQIYDHDRTCAIIIEDNDGRKIIHEIKKNPSGSSFLKTLLPRVMGYFKKVKKSGGGVDWFPVQPPTDVARSILDNPTGFPKLTKIERVPFIRSDGSIIDKIGYDKDTHIYYDPPHDMTIEVPKFPTEEEVASALATIKEPFEHFPFISESDRANYLGFLLTSIVRPAIGGNVPLAVISSPIQGSGKSKLAFCLSRLASDGGHESTTAPERGGDGEMRKRITAALMRRPSVFIIDNVVGQFDSPALASAITAGVWADRRLGHSEMITVPVRTCFVATGVNIETIGDLTRRCVWIGVDPEKAKPWESAFPFDPELFVQENRFSLICALLVLAMYWFSKGKPNWNGKPLGSFESWANTIGGILHLAGVEGFLENREHANDSVNQEIESLSGFYEGWQVAFGHDWVRSGDIIKLLAYEHRNEPDSKALRAGLLEEMMPIIDALEGRAATKMAMVLRKYRGRIAAGLRLERKTDSHTKHTLWAVLPVAPPSQPLFADSADTADS